MKDLLERELSDCCRAAKQAHQLAIETLRLLEYRQITPEAAEHDARAHIAARNFYRRRIGQIILAMARPVSDPDLGPA